MNDSFNQIIELIKHNAHIYIPATLVYVAFVVFCIINLFKQTNMKNSKRVVWLVVILFIQVLGPVAYLFIGKRNE